MEEAPPVVNLISVQRIEQVLRRIRPALLIGHTVRAHTHTHLQRHTVPDGCPPAHIKQTVMRRKKKSLVTALHRQLSPAAPVSFNCAYRQAGGHAVAKEVAVSMQELAGKHPQS